MGNSVCPDHERQPQALFCTTDDTPICLLCANYGSHKGHSPRLVKEAAAESRATFRKQLGESEGLLASLATHRAAISQAVKLLRENGDAALGDIERAVEEVIAAIRARGEDLRKKAQELVEAGVRDAAERQERLAVCRAQVDATIAEITQALKSRDDVTLLRLTKPVNQHVADAAASIQQVLALQPIAQDMPHSMSTKQIIDAISAFGSVGMAVNTTAPVVVDEGDVWWTQAEEDRKQQHSRCGIIGRHQITIL